MHLFALQSYFLPRDILDIPVRQHDLLELLCLSERLRRLFLLSKSTRLRRLRASFIARLATLIVLMLLLNVIILLPLCNVRQ